MKTLVELGFSKNLAIRELDALIKLSTNKYKKVPVSDSLVIVETKKPIDWQWIINQSGSLVRSCELLAQKSDLEMAKKFVGQHLKDQAKVYFSAYSFPEVENLIPQIKDELKEVGQNPRYISSENSLVSPLTITAKKIHEFVFIGTSPIEIYKTTHVSPSKDWKIRDRGRPSVDHAAGILPPKIARTLLNLSLTHKGKDQTILDPFCGSGTIVNEALVSGFKAIGSDVSEQAIKDSQENVQWLEDLNQIKYSYQLIHSSAQELKLEEEDLIRK